MKIPKSIQLLAHTITVEVVPKAKWKMEDAVGYWVPGENRIVLLRQPRTQLAHTYLHEVTHAVLDAMNHKLSRNEPFVDQFAGLLAQALESGK